MKLRLTRDIRVAQGFFSATSRCPPLSMLVSVADVAAAAGDVERLQAQRGVLRPHRGPAGGGPGPPRGEASALRHPRTRPLRQPHGAPRHP
eukprot:1028381-Prorocentrum_minimum.AAC.1